MPDRLQNLLKENPVKASAPCRIDMGGTLDIPVFHYTLRHLAPCTFNAAIALRTRVRLGANSSDLIKVSSKGFESAQFPLDSAPFDHPLGLIFAIAAYFHGSGVHIHIESESPPNSALGGSSAATVAVIAAFDRARQMIGERPMSLRKSVLLAHAIESAVLGIPCGLQDQLAAAYGGVNAWYWLSAPDGPKFEKEPLLGKKGVKEFEERIMLAYCGAPHVSSDVNTTWMRQFAAGTTRDKWVKITKISAIFVEAVSNRRFKEAADAMNKELDLRLEMTPGVLTPIMETLVLAAQKNNCGARFTGAGAGGCVWALGEKDELEKTKSLWTEIIAKEKDACFLDADIDPDGIIVR